MHAPTAHALLLLPVFWGGTSSSWGQHAGCRAVQGLLPAPGGRAGVASTVLGCTKIGYDQVQKCQKGLVTSARKGWADSIYRQEATLLELGRAAAFDLTLSCSSPQHLATLQFRQAFFNSSPQNQAGAAQQQQLRSDEPRVRGSTCPTPHSSCCFPAATWKQHRSRARGQHLPDLQTPLQPAAPAGAHCGSAPGGERCLSHPSAFSSEIFWQGQSQL